MLKLVGEFLKDFIIEHKVFIGFYVIIFLAGAFLYKGCFEQNQEVILNDCSKEVSLEKSKCKKQVELCNEQFDKYKQKLNKIEEEYKKQGELLDLYLDKKIKEYSEDEEKLTQQIDYLFDLKFDKE